MLTVPDSTFVDLLRGAVGAVGCLLLLLGLTFAARNRLPRRLYLRGAADACYLIYVVARELQQIRHPVFLLGLPLAAVAFALNIAWLLQANEAAKRGVGLL